MVDELMRNRGAVGDAIGVILTEVVKQDFPARAGAHEVQCATFEFADKSVVQSLRVSLFDDGAGMVAEAKVGDSIYLSRLRVKRYGAEGYVGYVGHGGSARIIPAGSREWIDPVLVKEVKESATPSSKRDGAVEMTLEQINAKIYSVQVEKISE